MIVSSELLNKYSSEVNEIAEIASESAMAAYRNMRLNYPNASVSEVRESSISIVESVLASCGAGSGELAAELYDSLASDNGTDVPSAIIPDINDQTLEIIDREIRYAVRDLIDDREDI